MKSSHINILRRPDAGFTVVELMIVISLLVILISVVIISMSRVRQSANRAETTNALRQMVVGYAAYMQDHRQRLMPGFLDPEFVQQLRINAERPDNEGRFITDFDSANEPYEDISSYVWRLAPYLDFNWQVTLTDYTSGHPLSRLTSDVNRENPWFGPASFGGELEGNDDVSVRAASMIPSIGLNSIFLGGDTRHGGSYATDRHPWSEHVTNGSYEKLAATRYTEVRNPSQIVVFAPVGRASAEGNQLQEATYVTPYWTDIPIGYPELRPPFLQFRAGAWTADSRQWRVGRRKEIERRGTGAYGDGAGLPIMRYGTGVLPVAHLDGSAMVEDIELLSSDMRRWAPGETGTVIPRVETD